MTVQGFKIMNEKLLEVVNRHLEGMSFSYFTATNARELILALGGDRDIDAYSETAAVNHYINLLVLKKVLEVQDNG